MRSRLRWFTKHILGWEPMPPAPPRKVYENVDNLGYFTRADAIDQGTQRKWLDWVESL